MTSKCDHKWLLQIVGHVKVYWICDECREAILKKPEDSTIILYVEGE